MAEYFTNIVGNEALRARLAHDVLSSSLSHAYIIEGREGSGRRTLALNIAAALSCQNRSADKFPCLECDACRKILDGKTPDVMHIVPERDRVSIGVDASRFIRSDAMVVPNDFEYKVYIIDPADTMTEQAQNALLLTLEEPHSYAVFFLICTSAASMLETVRSRAPVIRTEPVTDELLSEYIRAHDSRAVSLAASSEQYAALLRDADGCIGKALALLDPKRQKPSEERHALAEKFVKTLARPASEQARLELIANFSTKRDEVIPELIAISTALRDLILLKKTESAPLCFYTDREDAIDISYRFTTSALFALYNKVSDAIDALSRNANLRLTLTALTA
ncbi:MAG: hypothetical protein IJY27_02590 [Clostridia bacterium]|nr:hypothetical protein [Clostridia bacterium]